ncbi:alpha/beta hydrolase [Variovorax sp. CF079]|uniref:alpha/beta fold hydrolase n=1 Tax=Variovorax sp. CF079 TaxID=1882774 RepID=UPI001BB04D01|nr:alpha/beta hydrolase [Variovorax sp. CF079]
MTDDELWRDVAPIFEDHELMFAALDKGATLEELAKNILLASPPAFVLIGFSMGGYVARQMAYLAPERVQALVLAGTSAVAGSPSASSERFDPASFQGLSHSALARALHPSRAGDVDLLSRLRAMSNRVGGETFVRLSAIDRPSDVDRLATLKCPTLVIAAAQDRLRSVEESKQMAEILHAEMVVVDDCGHMIPIEQPAQFAHIVRDWLSRLP